MVTKSVWYGLRMYIFFLYLADRPSTSSVSNMQEGKNKDLPSFWVPSMTPAANATKMDKPVMLIYYWYMHSVTQNDNFKHFLIFVDFKILNIFGSVYYSTIKKKNLNWFKMLLRQFSAFVA